ncbi:peptidoglycan DD-metalloendopeptidase family protein [Flavihumibacter petaseus]|uniref:Peptidase M23 family protein n=1 Tax=Flavihumibacter petaseus NBRC 106054 TaxID=1220578 RepID=A0A0E9N5T3_9BACT|nr:peptidoglycan DD-metalloendopeptidase family protein [Flavihumibacter petaseus]GAO45046.1 peptidase M23 family protein [Flavihumibacter petaseus NBRC 106054]
MPSRLLTLLLRYQSTFHPVIEFDADNDRLVKLDLSPEGLQLPDGIIDDTTAFTSFIENYRAEQGARYLVGGYGEYRPFYQRSRIFQPVPGEEPRRLHLGTDIWGAAGSPVFAFMGGMVHAVANHPAMGDYGAMMIIDHQLEGSNFFTLYGHLSHADLSRFAVGQYVNRGQEIAQFGSPAENGHWPPHLHFQVIDEMGSWRNDYPGVCRLSEKEQWLNNCPDPEMILRLNRFLSIG